jgi:phosphomethylpyrimidine synthase
MIKYKKRDKDLSISIARRDLDWNKQFEVAITADRAREIRRERSPAKEETCTMCGEFCALRMVSGYFKKDTKKNMVTA